MIEPDGVDEDYFTPVAGTTLESIFSSTSRDIETENESLKYIPSKPATVSKPVPKATECLIACAFFAYEWNKNAYMEKGKLGFAIMKYLKNNTHEIVLYDSNKTTMAKSTITSQSHVCVMNKLHISFYDNHKRFWCIYGMEKEVENVIEILKKLNVVVKYSQSENALPSPDTTSKSLPNTELPKHKTTQFIKEIKQENTSDTDSSMQGKKTKDAILARMANMGQSVLPPRVVSPEKISDSESTDINDAIDSLKSVRKKSFKSSVKRNPKSEDQLINEHKMITPIAKNSPEQLYTCVNGIFLPIGNSNESMSTVFMKHDNDLHFFITEQRVSSSEIRINLGRLNDKIDQIIDNVKGTQNKQTINANSSCQFEIVQKLLLEYENKIKRYEKIIETNELNRETTQLNKQGNDIEYYKNKVLHLEEIIRQKDQEIEALTKRLKLISNK